MSIDEARLYGIPCITAEALSEIRIRITADDGFRLIVNKVQKIHGLFWKFENNPPSAIVHLNLRYKIDKALNYP